MSAVWLSVVIPAFNEARCLGTTLQRIRDYATAAGRPCEAVIVDDGSTDGTADVARGFAAGPLGVQLLVGTTNRGKGHAVRQGMLAASGELLLLCDADLSTPIEEVNRLLPWIDRGWDVAIGSRDLPESRLDPPQPATRRWLAWAFRALRRRLLLPGLRDTQCGFKLLRRDAARAVFERVTLDGWLFDCEVLGIADRLGYRIREVGIVWRNHPESRVKHWREALTAVPTLLALRRRLRKL
jgi:dolichyl-phosphate beta-glucosyltransferase